MITLDIITRSGTRGREREGLLMKMHTIVSRPLTSHLYNTGEGACTVFASQAAFHKGDTCLSLSSILALLPQRDFAMGS